MKKRPSVACDMLASNGSGMNGEALYSYNAGKETDQSQTRLGINWVARQNVSRDITEWRSEQEGYGFDTSATRPKEGKMVSLRVLFVIFIVNVML